MLSYQHIYHAGNMADVQKHLWLIAVLDYLTKKDKPFFWLDTHAGRGLYDLKSAEAQKIKEYESGILKFYDAIKDKTDLPPTLQRYRDFIQKLNPDGVTKYPGSAYLAAKIMRPTDKLFAYELHKGEYPYLEKTLKNYINSTTRFEDGFKGLKSHIPPQTIKRGGVLIDPSYEIKDDYANTAKAVINAYQKWPQGIYMVWYPILDKAFHTNLIGPLKALNLPVEDFIIDEWHFGDVDRGMKGTGMVILNPPYGCTDNINKIKGLLFS
jgi:23S rRNA (adenine2030-N6)-methyltransferase